MSDSWQTFRDDCLGAFRSAQALQTWLDFASVFLVAVSMGLVTSVAIATTRSTIGDDPTFDAVVASTLFAFGPLAMLAVWYRKRTAEKGSYEGLMAFLQRYEATSSLPIAWSSSAVTQEAFTQQVLALVKAGLVNKVTRAFALQARDNHTVIICCGMALGSLCLNLLFVHALPIDSLLRLLFFGFTLFVGVLASLVAAQRSAS